MRGHEHFGFKDGISQPGVRGRLDSPARPPLTPRLIASSDPLGETFAAPGQPLLWPGEFVLGYPRNDQNDPLEPSDDPVAPPWSRNGSFLVFRRLYQNVPAFLSFLERGVAAVASHGGFGPIDVERFGAMCVGRWKSGTPIIRAPLVDDLDIAHARNDAANSFRYAEDTVPVKWASGVDRLDDTLPPARRDFDGLVCPLAAHIRKVNPRDDPTDKGDNSARTLRHRIMRRGIPYGDDYDPAKPGSDAADRGLLFISYQTDIERQFEFLQRDWVNQENAPRGGGGVDPVIGGRGLIRLVNENDNRLDIAVAEPFVIATGGAYVFVPSISAIRGVLAKV
jgi:Dyp-type peroxidase family